MTRALFVNSGLLGHRALAGLMPEVARRVPGLEARHLNLSDGLTIADRVIRRLFSLRLAPRSGPAANLDLLRWRQELNVGLLAARRIAAAERDGAFDLLHFHTQATAYASLARMRRTPSIVSLDCTQHLASLEAASRLGRASYQANVVHDGYVFRAAAAIVATSDWAARDLVAGYPDCAAKVSVLPFPVAVDAFDAGWIAERAARARHEPDYRPRVLFVGGDFPRKGGPELLDAWRAGGFSGRAHLDLVTDWPLPDHAIPQDVTVVRGVAPYSDRWLALWRRADLFVMPARHEAFGIVYEESAASGIPAIGSDINAVPEIIAAGVTGLLVRPGDRDGLVQAMRTLVGTPALRERMGRAARAAVSRRASVPAYAATLATIIDRIDCTDRNGPGVTHDVRQPA